MRQPLKNNIGNYRGFCILNPKPHNKEPFQE